LSVFLFRFSIFWQWSVFHEGCSGNVSCALN